MQSVMSEGCGVILLGLLCFIVGVSAVMVAFQHLRMKVVGQVVLEVFCVVVSISAACGRLSAS